MAGPRLATPYHRTDSRSRSDVRYFGQMLIGGITSDVIGGGRAIRPGIGMDVRTQTDAIIRVQLDYTAVVGKMTGRSLSGARAMLGVVFGG